MNTNMKIATRLILGFGLVQLLLIATTIMGITRMASMQSNMHKITGVNNVQTKLITAMRLTVYERAIALRSLALVREESLMQPQADRVNEQAAKYRELEAELLRTIDSKDSNADKIKAMMGNIKRFEQQAVPLMDNALERGMSYASQESAHILMNDLLPVQKKWMDELDALIDFQDKQNEQDTVEAESAYHRALWLMLGMGVLAAVVGMVAAFKITHRLIGQLGGEPDYAAPPAIRICQLVPRCRQARCKRPLPQWRS
ncbi:MAG: methyl-accepting chemotaxis protein [Paucimonas sp.]|nr:methyl-accepting chemotaxis protein [Paucimonas sp.]